MSPSSTISESTPSACSIDKNGHEEHEGAASNETLGNHHRSINAVSLFGDGTHGKSHNITREEQFPPASRDENSPRIITTEPSTKHEGLSAPAKSTPTLLGLPNEILYKIIEELVLDSIPKHEYIHKLHISNENYRVQGHASTLRGAECCNILRASLMKESRLMYDVECSSMWVGKCFSGAGWKRLWKALSLARTNQFFKTAVWELADKILLQREDQLVRESAGLHGSLQYYQYDRVPKWEAVVNKFIRNRTALRREAFEHFKAWYFSNEAADGGDELIWDPEGCWV